MNPSGRFSFADAFTLLCVIAIGVALAVLPWVDFLSQMTWLEMVTSLTETMPVLFWAVPIAAIAGGIAAIAGLVDRRARRWTGLIILIAGLAGLAYFASVIISDQSFSDLRRVVGMGFWLTLAGFIGFVFQIVLRIRLPNNRATGVSAS